MPRNVFHKLLVLALGTFLLASACKSNKKAETETETKAAAAEAVEPSAESEDKAPEPGETKEDKADDASVIAAPFFYKVTGPEGASGHILGTMHMGIDADKELPAVVWQALGESTMLVTEANISDPGHAKGMMLPKDQNLRELLGEESWKLLEDRLGSTMAKMMMSMKPAAAASTLAMQGLPITMPMEMSLTMKAQEAKLELDYLETAMFQLELLNKVMDVDFLKYMLDNPDVQDSSELLGIYRKGDDEALLKGMLDPKAWGANPETTIDLMIYKRNDDWIPKMEALFAKKKAFIGVGAAHLVGPRGVLASLEKKGYTIERIGK
jgi:uncharacterized protein YbaP (TraB family)